jgi:hypothetical protein
MRSPGRPPVRRDVERRFWVKIAEGLSSEEAAIACGASGPVGARWFRQRGGMPSIQLTPLCGRYLSFPEREELALLSGQGLGVRTMARKLGRAPSTISRELRRNAATRSGQIVYRASIAQWKAELQARRPKRAKLASEDRLREYVQDRLAGSDHIPPAVRELSEALSSREWSFIFGHVRPCCCLTHISSGRVSTTSPQSNSTKPTPGRGGCLCAIRLIGVRRVGPVGVILGGQQLNAGSVFPPVEANWDLLTGTSLDRRGGHTSPDSPRARTVATFNACRRK